MDKIKDFWNKVVQFFKQLLDLFKRPEESLAQLKNNKVSEKVFFKKVILPFIAICSVFAALNVVLYGSPTVASVCVKMLFTFIAFVAAFFISTTVCQKTLELCYNQKTDKSTIYQVVGVGFLVIYLLSLLLSIVNMFFLWILCFYVVYLLWIIADVVFGIEENNRGKFLFFNSISIIFSEALIYKILTLLVPNLSL